MNIDEMFEGVLSGNRRHLAKAITLIESKREEDFKDSLKLLDKLVPYSGNSIRIGITGTPGVGKSTFIESFGLYLISKGYKVAVLAVDPSSQKTGGSILGDKTRMEELSRSDKAFIRPSPSGDTLGGVARKTREAMIACEAAGYDAILVETVGVGQSEVAVADMVDIFTLLLLPNSGDELQGIKRGVMELSDVILVNKAEDDNLEKAKLAKSQIENALMMFSHREDGWNIPVILTSGLKGFGFEDYFNALMNYFDLMKKTGLLVTRRDSQYISWMWSMVDDYIKSKIHNNKDMKNLISECQKNIISKKSSPFSVAEILIDNLKNIFN
ncbi:methylmalonyl Co-A mutase-associated GTPase MeaB [Deferribacterales bacterium Es71-Z0220]|uniref:methylmalonyl Co-A mutase-associated GTPase MeaB n=1 Tax=Deferrivibrio essentukiensis TaxID=2880922 RepID=UPI001F60D230|nr:methylmalonyl Co-A mutase-associated GTPase MeaB [Deferrivibrio essentukiensis]MCB4204901.1 methylmalonyl Co-A mutase-associated GTPase MeaB [Deferrivibrio essentukiensis]